MITYTRGMKTLETYPDRAVLDIESRRVLVIDQATRAKYIFTGPDRLMDGLAKTTEINAKES